MRSSVHRVLLALALLVPAASAGAAAFRADPAAATRPCHDPWPCGPAWPRGLEGPFEFTTEPLAIASHDGAILRGTLVRPVLPPGVRAPSVLIATPYWGEQYPPPGEPDRPSLLGREPWRALAEAGFVVAAVNPRGSGDSDGCLEMWGPHEQRDMRVLVEWLAAQPWSNGRVGAAGMSYGGGTAYEAAVEAPAALKAIAVASPMGNPYWHHYSPQGFAGTFYQAFRAGYELAHGHDACDEAVRNLDDAATGGLRDARDAAFWESRDLFARFGNVTAAAFIVDSWPGAHDHQITPAWSRLDAPKRMLVGAWGHGWPEDALDADVVAWFSFWLKGVGRPEDLGVVAWSDEARDLRASTSWPPPESRALRLAVPAGSFRSGPTTGSFTAGVSTIGACPAPSIEPSALVIPLDVEPGSVLAGGPVLHLRVATDAPGGGFIAKVVDLAPGHACAGTIALDAAPLTWGGVDLRFRDGGYRARDVPVGAPLDVRVDLTTRGHALLPGHRLALVLGGEWLDGASPRWTPRIDVLDGSIIELPLVGP